MSSARELFYPRNKQFRRAEERAFAREELIYNVTEDILVTMENQGVTHKELARRLGKSRSFVSQVLNGARNMTLGSLSDICFALGIKPVVQVDVGERKRYRASVRHDLEWTEEAQTVRVRSPGWLNAANREASRRVVDLDGEHEWVNTDKPGVMA